MRDKCPEKAALLLFAEGELSAGDAGEISRHIARCPECEDAVTRLRAFALALRRVGASKDRFHGGRVDAPADARSSRDCPEEEVIAAYADGSLDAPAATGVERHLATCDRCLSEVADLWSMSRPAEHDAPDNAVAAVLTRLAREPRTAVLRLAERSIELVRDFASCVAGEAGGRLAFEPVPAVAYGRSASTEVRLHWSEGGAALEGVARVEGSIVSLTGRVTVEGVPATATSATLVSTDSISGPESMDADGRFGPWRLSAGTNLLRLSGLPAKAGGSAELIVRVGEGEPAAE